MPLSRPRKSDTAVPRQLPIFHGIEPWLWAMLALVLSIGSVRGLHPRFFNDSYQYLSVADNVLRHHQLATSIIYFDSERSQSRVPASETTQASGYSIAIYLLSWTHLAPETVAFVLSVVGFTGVALLLWFGVGFLGSSKGVRRLSVAAWVLNGTAIFYSTAIMSDLLFACVVVAGIVLLLVGENRHSDHYYAIPAGMLLITFAYCIRYAGLFFVLAAYLFILVRVVQRGPRTRVWLASLAGSVVIVGGIVVRNIVFAGTWTGGRLPKIERPIGFVLHQFAVAWYHLVFGVFSTRDGAVVQAACLASAVTVFLLLLADRHKLRGLATDSALAMLVLMFASYCVAVAYTQWRLPVEVGAPRYFLPLLPILILIIGRLCSSLWPVSSSGRISWVRILAVVFILGYGYCNLNVLRRHGDPPPHLKLALYFDERTNQGTRVSEWVERHLPMDTAIVATEGQGTGYLLRRPTVALASPEFTAEAWDPNRVHDLMRTYRASHLIVYPHAQFADDLAQRQSVFLRNLAEGRYPDWLRLEESSPHILIYQTSESQPTPPRQF